MQSLSWHSRDPLLITALHESLQHSSTRHEDEKRWRMAMDGRDAKDRMSELLLQFNPRAAPPSHSSQGCPTLSSLCCREAPATTGPRTTTGSPRRAPCRSFSAPGTMQYTAISLNIIRHVPSIPPLLCRRASPSTTAKHLSNPPPSRRPRQGVAEP